MKKTVLILSNKNLGNITRPIRIADTFFNLGYNVIILCLKKPIPELINEFNHIKFYEISRRKFVREIFRKISRKFFGIKFFKNSKTDVLNNKIEDTLKIEKISLIDWFKYGPFIKLLKNKGEASKLTLEDIKNKGLLNCILKQFYGLGRSRNFCYQVNKFIKKNEIIPNVIISHDNSSLEASYFIKKKYKSYFIYDCVEDTENRLHKKINLLSKLSDYLYLKIQRFFIYRANTIFFVSDALKNKFEKSFKTKNIFKDVIINKPHTKFKINTQKLEFKADSKKIVWIGSPYPAQGIEFIINIAKSLNSFNFYIIGNPQISWEKWYNELKLSSPKNVKFLSSLPPPNLIDYLTKFDAGIIPRDPNLENNKIALPNKFYEYLAAGLPILSTKFIEFENFVNRTKYGEYIFYNDVEKTCLAISEFFKKKNDLIKIKKNIIENSYWETEEKKINKLIKTKIF